MQMLLFDRAQIAFECQLGHLSVNIEYLLATTAITAADAITSATILQLTARSYDRDGPKRLNAPRP